MIWLNLYICGTRPWIRWGTWFEWSCWAFQRHSTGWIIRAGQFGTPQFSSQVANRILCERRQRVRSGQHLSEWSQVKAGVPQGTLVGPISFLLHISDLQTVVNHVKYVDDSSLWEVCGTDGSVDSVIQVATDQALEWSARNLMAINAEKTKEMMISFSSKPVVPPPVTINNTVFERTETFKLLGVVLSNKLD